MIKALNNKFSHSFTINIFCQLESENEKHIYNDEPRYILNTSNKASFIKLAFRMNQNDSIQIVVMQHEFVFFENSENEFHLLLDAITKPVVVV